MKSIKLLLIGFLLVGILLACDTSTVAPLTQAKPLTIVGLTNKVAPDLFDNVTVTIRAIDRYGKPVQPVTWTTTGLVNAVMVTPVDDEGATVKDGTTTIKITGANATGTITATAKIGDEDLETEYEIITSEKPLTKINVSPTNPTIGMMSGSGDIQLRALATFGSTKIDVTDDVSWTLVGGTPTGVTVDNVTNKGLVNVSSPVDTVFVEATLISGSVKVFDNTKVSSVSATIKKISITGAQVGIPIRKDESVKLSAIASFDVPVGGSATPIPVDITNDASWTSSIVTTMEVGNTVNANKGIATAITNSGDSTISASLSGITGTLVLTAGISAKDNFIISKTTLGDLFVGSDDQLQTTEIINGKYQPIKNIIQSDGYSCASSNTGIVTVDENCIVTGIKVGKSIITVTNDNKGTSIFDPSVQNIEINVSGKLESITIETDMIATPGDPYSLLQDTSVKLKASGMYDDGSGVPAEKDITDMVEWTTSDKKIASIDNRTIKGNVTAKSIGGVVTIKSSFDGVEGTIDIKITPTIVEVEIVTKKIEIVGKYSYILKAVSNTGGPVSGVNARFIWKATVDGIVDNEIATITQSGVLNVAPGIDGKVLVITVILKGFPEVNAIDTTTINIK